jgi:hypothetical protein
MPDTGYWILDAGCWILDAGCWMLDAGCWGMSVNLVEKNKWHYQVNFGASFKNWCFAALP